MKIIKLKAGFGNQMFQYAFSRMLEIKYETLNIKVDCSWIEKWYGKKSKDFVEISSLEKMNVCISKASKDDIMNICIFKNVWHPRTLQYKVALFAEQLLNRKYFFEKTRAFVDPRKIIKYDYFDGYWQSWKYLCGIEDMIRREFTPKNEFSPGVIDAITKIQNENSVFIGIRKGDYTKMPRHWGSFSPKYYSNAIDIIKKRVDNPIFYIFSNDIDWVKANLHFDCDVIFREKNDQGTDIEELFVMAACKHSIIINSTYHWWAAWLNRNPNKIVIAPQKWFADGKPIDIVPPEWIRL